MSRDNKTCLILAALPTVVLVAPPMLFGGLTGVRDIVLAGSYAFAAAYMAAIVAKALFEPEADDHGEDHG